MGIASWQCYCTASSSGRQPNFAALNRGRHLCSAGRPSGWALAHILVFIVVCSGGVVHQADEIQNFEEFVIGNVDVFVTNAVFSKV